MSLRSRTIVGYPGRSATFNRRKTVSCNCEIRLPPNVRLQTVAEVIGVLLGLKAEKSKLQGGGYSAEVRGISLDSIPILPTCVNIKIFGAKVGEPVREFLYHFEADESPGRAINPSSTALNIAMAERLILFFGGSLVANDCAGDGDNHFSRSIRPKTDLENMSSDGAEWENLQNRILALQPISPKEIARMEKYAAYKEEDLNGSTKSTQP